MSGLGGIARIPEMLVAGMTPQQASSLDDHLCRTRRRFFQFFLNGVAVPMRRWDARSVVRIEQMRRRIT